MRGGIVVDRHGWRWALAVALMMGLLGGWLPSAGVARAAGIVVDTLADPGGPAGTCSLRDALAAASTNASVGGCAQGAGADTITFAPGLAGTITLNAGDGALQLGNETTIDGGGRITISGGDAVGVIVVIEGASATLRDLTITGGRADTGGGIRHDGSALTLERVTVSGNTASEGEFVAGGGIYSNEGSLTLIASTVSGNTAVGDGESGGDGGGIYSSGTLMLSNTTVSGNTASGTGSSGIGGGIFVSGGPRATRILTNSTIANNTATGAPFFGTNGGGILNNSDGGEVILRNTIVAAPAGNSTCGSEGFVDEGGNLESGDACGLTAPTSQVNIDPRLGPLADNGGPTRTHLPAADSPALGAAVAANCPATDQRGITRPQGAGCDSGAVEVLPALTLTAITPNTVVAGAGGTVTLTLDGTGFIQGVSAARINGLAAINGGPIATTYVSPTRLTATFPAFPTGGAGSYAVTVTNAPFGGTSNALPLAVVARVTVTASAVGNGTVSPAGQTSYDRGTIAPFTATPAEGHVLLGWTLDGEYVGFPSPLDFTVNADRTLVATFVPRPVFSDVPQPGVAWEAITQLAARGVINGYAPDECAARGLAAPCYGPADPVARAQIAAMLVRTFGWDAERPSGPVPFSDLGSVDAELQRAVIILAQRGIAKGYGDGTYGPLDRVSRAQAISLIARSMVQAGYWAAVTPAEDDGTAYPNVPRASDHRLDLLTFVKYAGALPDRPTGQTWADWETDAPRTWTAQVLWQAYSSYFGVDRVP